MLDIQYSMWYSIVVKLYKEFMLMRKTHTSNEVKMRYAKKTYKQYLLTLRKVEDKELIDKIEELKEQGIKTSEAIKLLMQNK